MRLKSKSQGRAGSRGLHIAKKALKTGRKTFLATVWGRGKGNPEEFEMGCNRSLGEPVGTLPWTSLKEGDIV